MAIEWRIRESSHGGFYAELIGIPEPGILAGYKPGYIMGCIEHESHRFNTRKQAERYVERSKRTWK